jgi:hypothetical protein
LPATKSNPAETLDELTATELEDTVTLDELGATDDELAGTELELGAMLEELGSTINEELDATAIELGLGGVLETGATLDAGVLETGVELAAREDDAIGVEEIAIELDDSTAVTDELVPPGGAPTQAPRLITITAAEANLPAEIKEVILKAPPRKNCGIGDRLFLIFIITPHPCRKFLIQ